MDRSVVVEASGKWRIRFRVKDKARVLVSRTKHLRRQHRALQFALHEVNCPPKSLCDVIICLHEGVLTRRNVELMVPRSLESKLT